MTSPAHDSDRALAQAGTALTRQRAGRKAPPIGKRSAELRLRHLGRKLTRIVIAVFAVLAAAMIAGLVNDGIGFTGIVLTALALVVTVALLTRYPRFKLPDRAVLNRGSVRTLVGNTELWLEAQRPALPSPAVAIVDRLGTQLDALGLQLEGLDDNQPAVTQVRRLIGEHLPEVVSAYTAIPRHLRSEPRAGNVPDEQIAESLERISGEIDHVSRQIADGHIDTLAVRTRYLDYRYGEGPEQETP